MFRSKSGLELSSHKSGRWKPTIWGGTFWRELMSAIAYSVKLPKSALVGLKAAATGGAEFDYLHKNWREVAEYRWSGNWTRDRCLLYWLSAAPINPTDVPAPSSSPADDVRALLPG